MITLLSPAKTLNYDPLDKTFDATLPIFSKETSSLITTLRRQPKKTIKSMMKVSEAIADLNVKRYKAFRDEFTADNSKEAIFAFKGDVYLGFDAESMTKTQIKYAQKRIRILSGLYGLLKPLDLMQAYRLEMGTKLSTRRGKNLYEFWGDKITESINEELQSHKKKVIINLASNEYYKSVRPKILDAEVINVSFKEYKGEDLKFISFFAKRARGLMARYIVQNKVEDPEGLKKFDLENYQFSSEGSDENELLFIR